MSAIRVSRQDGEIDEIIAKGCDLHIERMDDTVAFIEIVAGETIWRGFIIAKNDDGKSGFLELREEA